VVLFARRFAQLADPLFSSGLGYAIGQRLIDEYLSSRPLSQHLIIIVTTRNLRKSRDTIEALQAYTKQAIDLSSRKGSQESLLHEDHASRIHILSVELDLCDLRSIFGAADKLVNGLLVNPAENGISKESGPVRIPRLDSVIFNAGFGGWNGIVWPTLIAQFLKQGLVTLVTWPAFMRDIPGLKVDPLKSVRPKPIHSQPYKGLTAAPETETLGEVFCANVFGHYVFAHAILPLMRRPQGSKIPMGRFIWESTLEGVQDSLDLDDFQSLTNKPAYEGTKRLVDFLALTPDLPAVRPYSDAFFEVDAAIPPTELNGSNTTTERATPTRRSTRQQSQREEKAKDNSRAEEVNSERPPFYLTHPGIMATGLFPLGAFLFFWYPIVLQWARWLGSPWHPITSYKGAIAPAYVALASQAELDQENMQRLKLGSATDWSGNEMVKKTEVDGWGWEGKLEDREALARDPATRVLRRLVGRHPKSRDLTQESLEEFEGTAAKCWKEMERLRVEWTEKYWELVKESVVI
jgi:3-keto steroid reductase